MDIHKLTKFFMWCTIINGILLILVIIGCMLAPELVSGVHGKLFHITREKVNMVFYLFIGFYKMLWLVFNLVPYVALRIVKKKYYN